MTSTNRPQKYRKILEVDAFRMDEENGDKVARWCGGKFLPVIAGANPEVSSPRVLVPYFNPANNIDIATANPGDYVIKNKDGTHDVLSAKAFAEKGLEPFYHRGNSRGANQSDE